VTPLSLNEDGKHDEQETVADGWQSLRAGVLIEALPIIAVAD
jgi:hypothetical protein